MEITRASSPNQAEEHRNHEGQDPERDHEPDDEAQDREEGGLLRIGRHRQIRTVSSLSRPPRGGIPPARLQAVALGIHEKFGPILGKRLTGLFVLFTDHLEDLLQLQ